VVSVGRDVPRERERERVHVQWCSSRGETELGSRGGRVLVGGRGWRDGAGEKRRVLAGGRGRLTESGGA